jgi:hypothetical protein
MGWGLKNLGTPGTVAKIYVPASRSPAWYAMLSNRVIGGGHKPKLVIVPAALHHMLDTKMDEQQATLLREQMGPNDAVIEQKAFGGSRFAGVTSRPRPRLGPPPRPPSREERTRGGSATLNEPKGDR